MKAGPRLEGYFITWGEAAGGTEPSYLAEDGWDQHMPASPSQELLWGMPWRTMVWALQVLHACRNLCLKPTDYNSLNLYYSSMDMLKKMFLSLCALCWALQDTYWPLQHYWFMWALLLLLWWKMWSRKCFAFTPMIGCGPFRSARGFYSPCCTHRQPSSPICNHGEPNSLLMKEEAPMRCSNWLNGRAWSKPEHAEVKR